MVHVGCAVDDGGVGSEDGEQGGDKPAVCGSALDRVVEAAECLAVLADAESGHV